jgi:large subunit ribosomal protein L21
MYAICKFGGQQHRLQVEDLARLAFCADKKPGDKLVLDQVLLVSDKGKVTIGAPHVEAKVHATVVDHGRDDKIIVYRKKRRTEYHKMRGHKQRYTLVKIDKIEA